MAWTAAQAADDPVIELEVLEHVNAARDEIDAATAADWELLEEKAQAIGRWQQVAVAGRIRAVLLADTDPRRAIPRLQAVADSASAHGLTEQAGWANYSLCEALWVTGEWDEALAVGRGAIEVAERYAYQRLAFRTFVVVLQIAAARGDPTIAEHWGGWWTSAADHFPSTPSPYARMLHGAIAVWAAKATGRPVIPPSDDLTDAVIAMGNPHFIGAIETVVRAALDSGRHDLAAAAAERSAANAAEPGATRLMSASAALLDAWVHGSEVSARTALALAREHSAPWWELRALHALGDPGAATIGHALGIGA
jgi:hypothetical protein